MTHVSHQPTHATHAKKFKLNVCQHMTRHEKLNSRKFIPLCLLPAPTCMVNSSGRFIRPVHSSVSFVRSSRGVAILPSSSTRGSDSSPVPMVFSVHFGRCHLPPINQDIFGGLLDVLRSGLALFPGLGTNFVEFFNLKYD